MPLKNKEALFIYQKAYRKAHKAVSAAFSQVYYQEHKRELKERSAKYYREHLEQCLATSRLCHANRREERCEYSQKYYREHREQCWASNKNWAQRNRAKCRAYLARFRREHPEKIRRAQDRYLDRHPGQRIIQSLRMRTRRALKGKQKAATTFQLLGCTLEEFKAHLARRFLPGMSFETYGTWHIDHVRPCASYDMLDPAQQRLCFHYSNLQPLWGPDNIRKGAKWLGEGVKNFYPLSAVKA